MSGLDLEELLEGRYSCREFLADPVPDDVVAQLFRLAQRAPSWCNTQPWQVHLIEGAALADLTALLEEHAARGVESGADLELPTYEGVYQDRRREAGFGLYAALGIDRDDRSARGLQMLRNFSFFGAPHTAIITTDRALGTYGAVDTGGYVSTLMLAAQSLGLGVIAQGAIAMYAGALREAIDIPADRLVVCAVSFGVTNPEHPANQFRTSRGDLAEVVHRVTSLRPRSTPWPMS